MSDKYTVKVTRILDVVELPDGWAFGMKQDEFGFSITIRKSKMIIGSIVHTRHDGISFRFSNEDLDTHEVDHLAKAIEDLFDV